MKIAPSIVLFFAALACASPERVRPELARSEVVSLAHQPADQVASRVCGLLHGIEPGSPADRSGGCTSAEHARSHHLDGTSHVSLIPDTRTNSIVLTVPPGRDEDLARAIALVREIDQPATAAK